MNQWGNAIQAMSPQAGQPGQGAGNVPYAKGVMSGQYGGIQDMFQKVGQTNGMQQARQGMVQFTSGADPSAIQMSPAQMQWTPEVQQHVMQYLMQLLQTTQPRDQVSTTGGFTRRG